MSIIRIAAKSALGNFFFFGAFIGSAILLIHYGEKKWRSLPPSSNGFLRALAQSGVDNSVLLAFMRSKDPIRDAKLALGDNPSSYSRENVGYIRNAIANGF